jgi:hypothetical protein
VPQSKQSAAFQGVNDLVTIITSAVALRVLVEGYLDRYNSEGYNTEWQNFATAALNPDGSQGTADGTPNAAHPITTNNINRSYNALIAGVTFCQDFMKFLNNQAVTTAQRSQSLDDLID